MPNSSNSGNTQANLNCQNSMGIRKTLPPAKDENSLLTFKVLGNDPLCKLVAPSLWLMMHMLCFCLILGVISNLQEECDLCLQILWLGVMLYVMFGHIAIQFSRHWVCRSRSSPSGALICQHLYSTWQCFPSCT